MLKCQKSRIESETDHCCVFCIFSAESASENNIKTQSVDEFVTKIVWLAFWDHPV